MTNHLPECQLATGVYDDRADCICDELRACEQRVRYTDWATDNAYWTGQTEGYTAALRDAVEAAADGFDRQIEYEGDQGADNEHDERPWRPAQR